MMKAINLIVASFFALNGLPLRASDSLAGLASEIYGEITSVRPGRVSGGASGLYQTMMMATARIPWRFSPSIVPISPILSAGFSSISGSFASTGLLITSPWMPRLPRFYVGARLEWRAYERTGPVFLLSASGEARQGNFLRLNADGDISSVAASGQLRAMIDAVKFPGIVLGAGVGGHVSQSEEGISQTPQAVTELRWTPAKAFLIDFMAKASPGVPVPQLIVSFGGAL